MKKIMITESQYKTLVNEIKNDNLHQFVDYIKQYGRAGTLQSEVEVNAEYINDNVRYIENGIFNSDEFEEFMEKNECDWLNKEDYEAEYERIVSERIIQDILNYLRINERGLIYIERNIKIPYFSKNNDVMSKLSAQFNGHLGEYWSYFFGQVVDPGVAGNEISLKGWVRPEDVNWTQTINANIVFPDEYELNISPDSEIEIDRITAVSSKTIDNSRSEYVIWNEPVIMNV